MYISKPWARLYRRVFVIFAAEILISSQMVSYGAKLIAKVFHINSSIIYRLTTELNKPKNIYVYF